MDENVSEHSTQTQSLCVLGLKGAYAANDLDVNWIIGVFFSQRSIDSNSSKYNASHETGM